MSSTETPTRATTGPAPADLVVTGAVVLTMDPAMPEATAFAVRDGRLCWVGTGSAQAWVGPGTTVVEAEGRTCLPGFIDAHNHVRLGSDHACVQLAGGATWHDVSERIGQWREERPDASWVECEGYGYVGLPGDGQPSAALLDSVVGDVPAFVLSYDVHTMWLNTRALAALGVTAAHTDLDFGTAAVDERGEPTGLIKDFAVRGLSRRGMACLRRLGVPWAGPDRQYLRLEDSLDRAIRCGITTIVEPQNSLDDLALFERAAAEGALRSRLIAALFHPRGTTPQDRREFKAAARRFDSDRFKVGPLKLYIDDVVEPHTAALHDDYANEPGNRGQTYYYPDEFAELITALDAEGFQAFVHATGDRGISTVLDAVAAARRANGPRDARHQVVHVECVRPADVPRFADLGVVACMQPRHASPEIAGPGHEWAAAVGPERWSHAWPMRSLHEAGAVLAFSSDWNVAEMEPMIGVGSAVTRRGLDGGDAWVPEQAVDVGTALHAYTMGSAYANFVEGSRGSITTGKLADFIVLDRDPRTVDPMELFGLEVTQTWVGGVLQHGTVPTPGMREAAPPVAPL